MFVLTKRLFGDRAALWAAATLNLAPVLGWTSATWVLPDGPLNCALLAGAYCVVRAVFEKTSRRAGWWLAAGAAGGVAFLSKLHAIFLFAGVGLFLVTSRQHRAWLATPWPYCGALIALALFLRRAHCARTLRTRPCLERATRLDFLHISSGPGSGERAATARPPSLRFFSRRFTSCRGCGCR
jgi:4-amino-4-deoxy-L-arabinose transferase-like glycosyltransferase